MQDKIITSDLVRLFVKSAEEVSATVEIVSGNAESLNVALKKIVENEPVLLAEPNNLDPALYSRFKLNPNVVTEPDKEQLIKIKVGITDAFCGIASTGSVCVPVANNFTSPASMLTEKHIVILKNNLILLKPREIFSEKFPVWKGLTKSFSIITGPSATADMGPLVRGVHGPGNLHIIILE